MTFQFTNGISMRCSHALAWYQDCRPSRGGCKFRNKNVALFRKIGVTSTPWESSPMRARALTLREYAVAETFSTQKPLFIKTALGPKDRPAGLTPSQPAAFSDICPSQETLGCASSGSQLPLGASAKRRSYILGLFSLRN